MIRIEDFTKQCGCRSAGECHCNTFAEIEAFNAVVDRFVAEMKRKFRQKWVEGKAGWDEPESYEFMRQSLIEHASRPLQHVDVANLAAMLWNLGEQRPASTVNEQR